ncbi:hypothetical protein SDC9_05909 [bioreactor metagenome]|uniref:Uncharacterized protein n=1 Tax=bioreactor metagenome TaxID=1076179 RepID=A0A644T074_9ZZZZ|nr:hypothetical protein [Negativicutes bacterium]
MSKILNEQLEVGIIFGDTRANEYIYMPGGEIGADHPLCVIERANSRHDISIEDAVALILRLGLRPAKHPLLGERSC